jgi:hypothetical protein
MRHHDLPSARHPARLRNSSASPQQIGIGTRERGLSNFSKEFPEHKRRGGGDLSFPWSNDEALYNKLNAAIADTREVMCLIRSGQGSAGKFINDPSLSAGKLFTDESLYDEARSAVARLNQATEQVNSIVTDIRAGRGTIGKVTTNEAIYHDARTAIAHFNTTAERIDNVVSAAQRAEGTVGKLLTDDRLYSHVNQLSSEGIKTHLRFPAEPEEIPDREIAAILSAAKSSPVAAVRNRD